MAEKVEEKFLAVLQNIEFALVGVYRANEKLTDYGADFALETLVKQYTAELLGRAAPPLPNFQPQELEAYKEVKSICEWRLGRNTLLDKNDNPVDIGGTNSLEDIITCLKRIRSSIKLWTKKLGRRGYYEFVKNYVK